MSELLTDPDVWREFVEDLEEPEQRALKEQLDAVLRGQ